MSLQFNKNHTIIILSTHNDYLCGRNKINYDRYSKVPEVWQ